MRIAAISYSDQDVYDGMCTLLDAYPSALVLFPITDNMLYVNSVAKAIKERKNAYTVYTAKTTDELKDIVDNAADVHITLTPIDDVLAEVSHGDLLAIVDDGSDELDTAISDLDTKGLNTWNFDPEEGPFDEFEDSFDEEDGEGDLIDALDVFTEAMVRYITKRSLEAMKEAIMKAVIERAEDFEDEDEDDY